MNFSSLNWHWRLFILLSGFAMVFLIACNEEEDDFSIMEGRAFFPLEIGKFRTYQVDSIIFDPSADQVLMDSSTTFFREEIIDIFQDGEGNDIFQVERSSRSEIDSPWEFQLVYTMENRGDYAIQNENNLRLKVFPFSLSENRIWTATNFFDENVEFTIAGERIQVYKNWESSFESLIQEETIGGFEVETITILHQNDANNVFERRFVSEKYAQGIGLVYREMQIFDSQFCNQEPVPDNCETIVWEAKTERGFSLKQTILAFN